MTDTPSNHEPTPEFHAQLKLDIARAYRSDRLFGAPATSGGGMRHRVATVLGIVAGVVVTLAAGMVLGASVSYASAAVPESVRPPLAILPIGNAINALRCSPAATTSPQTLRAASATPQVVTVVELSPPSAKTAQTLGAVLGIKEAPDGRLLVNDAGRRQMRLFEPSLESSTVVLDSVPGSAKSYGQQPTPLIPFVGDSSLFADYQARTMVVLDGRGQVIRAQDIASVTDLFQLTHGPSGVDGKGRVVYEYSPPVGSQMIVEGKVVSGAASVVAFPDRPIGKSMFVNNRPDSFALRRVDLEARHVDTVGYVAEPQPDRTIIVYGKDGAPDDFKRVINPLPTFDEWAVLSDGTIAIVRGHDYHVDWIHADGTKSSSPKLPFDWKHLTDDDKQRLIDSTRAAEDSADARWAAGRAAGRGSGRGTGGAAIGRGGEGGRGGADASDGRAGRRNPNVPREIVSLSQIADYWPALRHGAAMPDRDGNLWILPTTSAQSKNGELVYDVVNPTRGLIQRVRLPLGRSIAGFGKGGVVYLQAGDRTNGFILERTTLLRAKPSPK